MNKILVVFGTRPEAIKMAPVVKELKKNKSFSTKICVTSQHREMLDQVLSFFKLFPDYDLDLMTNNQSLNQLSYRIIKEIDNVLIDFKPDLVLVHGDTTTSSMVALASFNKQIKVGHIEAGLRTFNKLAPFPEEINRQITARIADFHFSPTKSSKQNLIKENINEEQIFVLGNTIVDALNYTIKKIEKGFINNEIKELQLKIDNSKKIILVTGHRRENFGKNIITLCNSLIEISKRDDVQVIYPVHLNPNIQEPVYDHLKNISNIILIEPLSYPSFIWLLKKSFMVITDSGGIQEEAATFGLPLLITREQSERMEAVDAGFATLVGMSKSKIINETNKLLDNFSSFENLDNPFGDGFSSKKIIQIIEDNFNHKY